MSLYRKQLKLSGARHVLNFELYDGDKLKYALFFATQSDQGCDKMKQAMWKVAPTGGYSFRSDRLGQLSFESRDCGLQRIGACPNLRVWNESTDSDSSQLKNSCVLIESYSTPVILKKPSGRHGASIHPHCRPESEKEAWHSRLAQFYALSSLHRPSPRQRPLM